MRLHGFSKFLAPVLLALLTLAIADDGSHNPNLYQFLDFTRVENSQPNGNRHHFKWLSKLRRSKNQKPAHSEPVSNQPEIQHDSPKPINYGDENSFPAYNPSFPQAAFKINPQGPGKNSKQSPYIILPPLPDVNQISAFSNEPNNRIHGSKQDPGHHTTILSGSPYKQTQPTPTSPAPNQQPHQLEEPTYSALELAFNAPKPSRKQLIPIHTEVYNSPQQTPNPGSVADSVSPPTHSDSRYSKWLNKLRRRKSNHNQPEKPQSEPLKVQDKPSEDVSSIPEPIYYQNSSPYNPSQPSINQYQPGNGQSSDYSRHPQITNSPPQVTPLRPANINQHSAPPVQSETLNSPIQPINYNSQNNFPHSSAEAPEPSPPSGNFYSKFMKKIKRNKNQKLEPVTVVSQSEPIFTPLQTAYTNPPSEPSVNRHPQTSPQTPQPPQASQHPRPAHQIIKPQPTASPAPFSSLNQAFNTPEVNHPAEAPTPYSPQSNSPARPPFVPDRKPTHSLHQESDAFFPPPNRPDFVPTPFQKQSEKVNGNNGDSEGFFEFGIFPQSNGFFDQNFKG